VIISILISYLLGSIPFGYLIVSARTGSDIRETGSGGTGATNVSRRAGKTAGILTLILDAVKGSAAVVISSWLLASLESPSWWIGICGVVAMLGHVFPVWLRFRGGKGVATGVGVFAVISPLAVLCSGIIFFMTVWLTRYVSLGSMLAAVSIPCFVWLLSLVRHGPYILPILVCTLAGCVLIIYAHRANLGRLLSGTESKFR
jgi:glycerol-3-phosphate acyltransferase PlsY